MTVFFLLNRIRVSAYYHGNIHPGTGNRPGASHRVSDGFGDDINEHGAPANIIRGTCATIIPAIRLWPGGRVPLYG